MTTALRGRGVSRLVAAGLVAVSATVALVQAASLQRGGPAPVTIPFEPATRHIVVPVTVNGSRPLSFVLDTGADVALIQMDVARELGLTLEGQLRVGGAGSGTQTGAFVRKATWSLVGLPGVSQPLAMAIPLGELSSGMGRSIDGIIGGQFIRQFVVEIDYQSRRLHLHDARRFSYAGSGTSVPIDFTPDNHPVLRATVTPVGGQPLERPFIFDIGSGQALILHSPFVAEQKLPGADVKTIPVIGAAGAGGRVQGRIGRVAALQIGPYTLKQPITMFAADKAGAFANPALAGNIGAQIGNRFRLFLDYGRRRIIFEPAASFARAYDRAFSGMSLRGEGPGFRTLRVRELLDDAPASEAGIRVGDIVTAVDGQSTAQLTLSEINEKFEVAGSYEVTILRGTETLRVTLKPVH